MNRFLLISIALGSITLTTTAAVRPVATAPEPEPLYYCGPASPSNPRIVNACGTKVCEYRVTCFALGDAEPTISGSAYCPTRSSSTCAPYRNCTIKSSQSAQEVRRQIDGQCAKFNSAPASGS